MSRLIFTSVLFVFTFSNVFAGSNEPFSITVEESKSFVLDIDKVFNGEVQVSIFDDFGSRVFKENISVDKVEKRKYDLRNLPIGTYSIQVEYDHLVHIQKVKAGVNRLEVLTKTDKTIYKPFIEEDKGMVAVNFLNFDGKFKVSIIDADGNLVYKEQYDAVGPFHKKYDMTKLPIGGYSFYLDLDNDSYSNTFKEYVSVNTVIAGD